MRILGIPFIENKTRMRSLQLDIASVVEFGRGGMRDWKISYPHSIGNFKHGRNPAWPLSMLLLFPDHASFVR